MDAHGVITYDATNDEKGQELTPEIQYTDFDSNHLQKITIRKRDGRTVTIRKGDLIILKDASFGGRLKVGLVSALRTNAIVWETYSKERHVTNKSIGLSPRDNMADTLYSIEPFSRDRMRELLAAEVAAEVDGSDKLAAEGDGSGSTNTQHGLWSGTSLRL